jgi:16S rRNA (guanine966-N2)-methyltransferase
MNADAVAAIHRLQQSRARFDVIFLDPPYGYGWISTILPLCVPLLASDGMVYAESDQELHASGGDDDGVAVLPAWMDGWETARADKAGVVAFQLLKRKSMADFQA